MVTRKNTWDRKEIVTQTDEQTEWTNQEVKTYLHIFCANNPQQWTDFLLTAEFHHNSVPHSSTKVSPFFLLHGYEPWAYPPLGKIFLLVLENCLTTLEEAQKEALAAHETVHWIMKEWNTWDFSPWKVGDKVWLEATNLCLNYPSRKLAPKWQGPFEISQVLSPLTYCLCLPTTWKIHDVFHCFSSFPLQGNWSTWSDLLKTSTWSDWSQGRVWSWTDCFTSRHFRTPQVSDCMEGISIIRKHLGTQIKPLTCVRDSQHL